MATAVGIDNPRCYNSTVFHIIDPKLLSVAEVPEDLSIFINYCNFYLPVFFGVNCFIDFLN